MICIRMRVITQDNQPIKVDVPKELRFPNSFKFPFDVMNPVNWQIFIENFRFTDGSKIPKYTKDGARIYRDAYILGGKTMIKGKYRTYYQFYNEYRRVLY